MTIIYLIDNNNKDCIICYENTNLIIHHYQYKYKYFYKNYLHYNKNNNKKCILHICENCFTKIKEKNICPFCRKELNFKFEEKYLLEIIKLIFSLLILFIIVMNYFILVIIFYYIIYKPIEK